MNLFQVNLFVRDFPAMLVLYRDKLGFEVNDIDADHRVSRWSTGFLF